MRQSHSVSLVEAIANGFVRLLVAVVKQIFDPTRQAVFDLAAIAAGTTQAFALPDVSTELAGLSRAVDL